MSDSDRCTIFLDANSEFGVSSTTVNASRYSWPTLPFSVSLGNNTASEDSLVFGNRYDASAASGNQWSLLPETVAPSASFLTDGKRTLTSAQLLDRNHAVVGGHHQIVLDFNYDGLMLGDSGGRVNCTQSFGLRLKQPAGFPGAGTETDIILGHNLSDARQNQYYQCEDPSDSMIRLGKPFFQAAMMHVNSSGAVYSTQANQQALKFNTTSFEPSDLTIWQPPVLKSEAGLQGWADLWTVSFAMSAVVVNMGFLYL